MQSELDIPHLLISRLTTTAILAAQKGGNLLKKSFGSYCEIKSKTNKHDLVTEYDEKVEKLVIESIQNVFPDHIFLGEESGNIGENPQAIRWIIDPLDGTMNFAHSIPVFSISIAATFQNTTLCGVVYNPMNEEIFIAEKNYGAFLNGQKLKVSDTTLLSDAILATGFPTNLAENPKNCIQHLEQFLKLGLPVRRLGSAALDLCYVAAGRYDGYFEVALNPWDFAAGLLIIEEAGGKLTTYENTSLSLEEKSSIIASNGHIHEQIRQQIEQVTN